MCVCVSACVFWDHAFLFGCTVCGHRCGSRDILSLLDTAALQYFQYLQPCVLVIFKSKIRMCNT